MPTLLKLKVKTKLFAKKLIGNSLFQLLLIALILLPFAYLNLKGWYELLYVIFGLVLLLIFLSMNEDYMPLAFILFIIAGIYYLEVAVMPTSFNNFKPLTITNPLTNFFIFFSFDFMLATLIYMIFFYNPIGYYEDPEIRKIEDEIKKVKI